MEWVNRIGMLLEFLSFWFAAPEILGEARLKAWEDKLEGCIGFLPILVGTLAILLSCIIMEAPRALLGVNFADMQAMPYRKLLLHILQSFVVSVVGFLLLLIMLNARKWTEQYVAEPLLEKLANDENIRRRSLAVGVIMFVVGFFLQIVATF